MPITTRHLMLDSLLLLLSASFIIVGFNGLLLSWLELIYSPLHLLLVADGFMVMLLGGAGLVCLLAGWSGGRLLAGGLLGALLLQTLVKALLNVEGPVPSDAEASMQLLPVLLLVPVALCLLMGRPAGRFRWFWAGWGALLGVIGGVVTLAIFPALRPWFLEFFDATLMASLVMAGLLGLGMMVAALRGERPLELGRFAVGSGLTGVVVSSLVWLLLSWQQEEALDRQAAYLLDNIQLNAEQVMASRLSLMRRMAAQLESGEADPAPEALARHLEGYLRDVSSLKAVGLFRQGNQQGNQQAGSDELAGGDWAWLGGRDEADSLMASLVNRPQVRDWLSIGMNQAGLMHTNAGSQGLFLASVDVPGSALQLVSLVDLSEFLFHELRLQLGLYRVVVLGRGEALLEIRHMGPLRSLSNGSFVNHLMQRRHIGLPGGPMMTLEVYPGTQNDWLLAGLMPVGVASGGLALSGMLVFSLALAGQLLGRTRALGETREQLEAQQAVQALIVREEPLETILAAVCRMLERQIPGSLCSIMLTNDAGSVLTLVAGDSLPEGYRQAMASITIGEGIGACGSAAHLAETVICEDLADDPRWKGYHQLALDHGLRACWSLPVLGSDNQVLGTFATYLLAPGAPDASSHRRLSKAADLVALAVERHKNRRTLRLLERSVEESTNGVVIADATRPDLPIIYVNAAFTRISGYSKDEALERNCRFLQGPQTDEAEVARLRQQLRDDDQAHVTLLNYRKDGVAFWNDLSISPVRDAEGNVTHYVGMLHDVTERKTYESQLAHHANHDALTGLANRSLFEGRLDCDVGLMSRGDEQLAVLFVDLDDFKPINDTLGHAVGDDVLREVARRLQMSVRPGDMVARMGGDEFVLLMSDVTQDEQVLTLVDRLMLEIARPYLVNDHELYLTCSVGIALSDPCMNEPRELIQHADMAMYKAKQQGRNAFHWYTREITEQMGERMALRNELQEAIESNAMELHYQPLIARDGSLAGVEALLRWKHPVRGYVSPEVFIPLAESTGQIIPLSRWVLERACDDMVLLAQQGIGKVRVAVNLSPLQFHRPNFLATLRDVLHTTGLPTDQLDLELTEGILMDNTESAIGILHALRGMQIGVSIDDFGTGYSSLSYLRHLPISKVKIDRSFVMDVTTNPHDAAIVQGIISMAGHLGLEVVAEGVETQAQHDQLQAWGCNIFQGFLLARPMPLSALSEFLRR
ncbi:putative bifunctional diguanylate cyclase/phosphodiesterase [Halomonas sp.]|uniref:putative bifunctional diguanylate cyclase/phosphodiesterase n=1 Tax=Halomonas sp. TaxID=1486246 RepID=UPI003851358D